MARRNTYRRRRLAAASSLVAAAVVVGVLVSGVLAGTNTHGARLLRYTIDSGRVHQSLAQVAVIPSGSSTSPRPLLVFLHGKGENQESNLTSQMFAALQELGPQAPDIVFPYGGEDSYWHDRQDGAWAQYVMREVIPQAERRLHSDPRRVAIGGLSMGGFGAYDLARLHPGRFCAVGGDSPAIWENGGESAQGAFDNAEDFDRNDLIGAARSSRNPYPGASLWIDVGSEDPFRRADSTFAYILKEKGLALQFHVWPGGHNQEYWSSHWASYLRFYANALAHCG
jgi:S-formylglutathione hydrolase FrmB